MDAHTLRVDGRGLFPGGLLSGPSRRLLADEAIHALAIFAVSRSVFECPPARLLVAARHEDLRAV